MITTVLAHLFTKLSEAMQHIWAWFAAIGLFFIDIFAGHAFIVNLVVAVTLMDAVWGITVSLKQNGFVLSELMRQTIGKVAVYGCALFGVAGIDYYIGAQTGLEMTITTAVVGVVIVLTELWSSSASMLILFPEFPFLRLLQKALTSEIARKLQIPEEEVGNVLCHNKGNKEKKEQ